MVDFFYAITTLFIFLASLKERIKATPNEVYFFCGFARYYIGKTITVQKHHCLDKYLNNLINFVNLEQEYTSKPLSKFAKKENNHPK